MRLANRLESPAWSARPNPTDCDAFLAVGTTLRVRPAEGPPGEGPPAEGDPTRPGECRPTG